MTWQMKVRELCGLDYRSLALLRIGIAVALLLDLSSRSRSLAAHYTDGGVLPRAELFRLWPNPWHLSVHTAMGTASWEVMLFVSAAAFALLLLIGYRTSLATFVSWLLLVSLQNRQPMVLQGGDIIFRVTLFWALFLPWGRVASFDYLLGRVQRPATMLFASAASLAYLVQTMMVYFMAALLKTSPIWRTEGTATYYALHVDQLVRPLGYWLRSQAAWLKPLTLTVWHTELLAPLVFFSPLGTGWIRTAVVFALIGMQVGFNTSMRLGTFGLIASVALLGTLPSWFWDTLLPRLLPKRGRSAPMAIYYDGACGLCRRFVEELARCLRLPPGTTIAPAATHPPVQQIMTKRNSWVIISATNEIWTGFKAFRQIVKSSPWAWPGSYFLGIPGIAAIGEVAYRLLARSRQLTCVELTPAPPSWGRTLWRWGNATLIIGLLALVIWWNWSTVPTTRVRVVEPFTTIAHITRLDQAWNMFTPFPLTDDGWYVMPGILKNGTTVDLFRNGQNVTYDKPARVAWTYRDQRWQKYMMNLWLAQLAEHRLGYGRYLCRTWNSQHQGALQLQSFTIIFMLERTPPLGIPESPAQPYTIWQHECFESPAS